MLPLPPFISPSLPSPTASLPFSQHYIHMYIPHPLFYSIPIPPFILYAGPASLPPNFAFFGHFLAISLLPAPSPTTLYPFLLFAKALHFYPGPSHPPAPACPPTLIFAFLGDFWMLYCIYLFLILYIHVHI